MSRDDGNFTETSSRVVDEDDETNSLETLDNLSRANETKESSLPHDELLKQLGLVETTKEIVDKRQVPLFKVQD